MLQSMCCLLTNLLLHSMHLLLESEAVMIYFCLFHFYKHGIESLQNKNPTQTMLLL